jgi:nicotinamide mononucleotide transporter
MVGLYAYVFFDAKLYSDMLLQCVYVVLQAYGWYFWARGGAERSAPAVRPIAHRDAWGWAAAGLLGSLALGTGMASFTDAAFPFIDAVQTVASLVAQWLTGRKILEAWIVWIGVDVISIGLYAAKSLYATATLYGVFLVLATLGYRAWHRSMTAAAAA